MARPRVRNGDITVVTLLFIVSIGVIFLAYASEKRQGAKAIVTVGGKRVAALPLSQPARLTVTGPLGDTIIGVDERGVFIVSSPCSYKYCIKLGHTRREGQNIVCAPNNVSIRIVGGDEPEIDGVIG